MDGNDTQLHGTDPHRTGIGAVVEAAINVQVERQVARRLGPILAENEKLRREVAGMRSAFASLHKRLDALENSRPRAVVVRRGSDADSGGD